MTTATAIPLTHTVPAFGTISDFVSSLYPNRRGYRADRTLAIQACGLCPDAIESNSEHIHGLRNARAMLASERYHVACFAGALQDR